MTTPDAAPGDLIHWDMALGPPDQAKQWHRVEVPGTLAAHLAQHGLFDPEAPISLHDHHACYRHGLNAHGPHRLILEGLATFADVYLDQRLILSSRNMFHRHDIALDLTGQHELLIHFAPILDAMNQTRPRARWRTRLVSRPGARHVRTTLLGQMPGWCPSIEAVGPWRPIRLVPQGEAPLVPRRILATLEGMSGRLEVEFDSASLPNPALLDHATLHCAPANTATSPAISAPVITSAPFARSGQQSRATLILPQVEPWWPQSHGPATLYDAWIETPTRRYALGKVGFRTLTLNRGADGTDFRLSVNGVPVFCRGAVWTSADCLTLSGTRETYEPFLRRARAMGVNMLRMSGIGAYETRAFYDLCAELGLMVWQDFMFANFDYPTADADFRASCIKEADDVLSLTMGSPALAILCGGSEMMQQAAMMGLPAAQWPQDLTHGLLAERAALWRPDCPYCVNSPSASPLPFSTDAGPTHYYGVGAYRRPLEDARRASLRFASECLAFSQVPAGPLDHGPFDPGPLDPGSQHWPATIPRDPGADWTFEDIRNHYLDTLFAVDGAALRQQDPQLWLHASRAITGHVMETTFAEWRRAGSTCNGALVWTFQDPRPGLGWGILNPDASPKPAAYALKRAFASQTAFFTDEGCNGLALHLINEAQADCAAHLAFACLNENGLPIVEASRDLILAPRSTTCLMASALLGAFYDTTYAYRFGPLGHYAGWLRLTNQAGEMLAEAFHFPHWALLPPRPLAFVATLESQDGGPILTLSSDSFLHFVHLDTRGCEAEDNWFHLAPGKPRRIRLQPLGRGDSTLEISALNSTQRQRLVL